MFDLLPPFIAYAKRKTPFHDGMGEERAELRFDCSACGQAIVRNALSCVDAGSDWFRSLPIAHQQVVADAFDCALERFGPNAIAMARFPNGRQAFCCPTVCLACRSEYVLAIEFYELQPARYIGVLQGAAVLRSRPISGTSQGRGAMPTTDPRGPSMNATLDFYFFIGSTYSYLSVSRATALAAMQGVELIWRPFSVRTLMREQNNSPFVGKPTKFEYMWRDLERRASRFGVPFDGAPPYPIDPEERANRVATLAAMEGWCEDFVREAYRTWFLDRHDPGTPETLSAILERLGKPTTCIERAEQDDVVARYAAQTDRARALGIFGSPSWVCEDGEMFWGDDRLEDAIDWCRRGRMR